MQNLHFFLPHGSSLQRFLVQWIEDSDRCLFSLKEVITLIRNYAMKKQLLQPKNRSIILSDKPLEKALGCKLMHNSQLIDIVKSKTTLVKMFRLNPKFSKVIQTVCPLKRKKVFLLNDVTILFNHYIRSVLHKIISSDNPQILILENEPLLRDCFGMKACHQKQLKCLMLSKLLPVHFRYKR